MRKWPLITMNYTEVLLVLALEGSYVSQRSCTGRRERNRYYAKIKVSVFVNFAVDRLRNGGFRNFPFILVAVHFKSLTVYRNTRRAGCVLGHGRVGAIPT